MADSVQLFAGEAIASVRGREVVVAGHRLHIGQDGQVSAPDDVAKRLLAQSGWSRYDTPVPPGVVTGAASGGHWVDASQSKTAQQPQQRRRGRPRKNRL